MNEITIVQFQGMAIIGQYTPYDKKLINPRFLKMEPMGDGVTVNLLPIFGHPKEIMLDNALFIYQTSDKKLISLYIKETTGLLV